MFVPAMPLFPAGAAISSATFPGASFDDLIRVGPLALVPIAFAMVLLVVLSVARAATRRHLEAQIAAHHAPEPKPVQSFDHAA